MLRAHAATDECVSTCFIPSKYLDGFQVSQSPRFAEAAQEGTCHN